VGIVARGAARVTVRELAEATCWTANEIAFLETGARALSIVTIDQLIDAIDKVSAKKARKARR
jgi:hypothetical protein